MKIYIKDKKRFKFLMGLLFALVFAVVNIVLMAKYGVSTVAACGFELSVLIGTIGLAISFVLHWQHQSIQLTYFTGRKNLPNFKKMKNQRNREPVGSLFLFSYNKEEEIGKANVKEYKK